MEKIKHKHNFQKGLSLLSLQLLRLRGERLGDGGAGGVRRWVTCDGDEIIDLLGVIIRWRWWWWWGGDWWETRGAAEVGGRGSGDCAIMWPILPSAAPV